MYGRQRRIKSRTIQVTNADEWCPYRASSPFQNSVRMYFHFKLTPERTARSISTSLWTTLAGVATLSSPSRSAKLGRTTLRWTGIREDGRNSFILLFATDPHRCRRSGRSLLRGTEERGMDACYCCVLVYLYDIKHTIMFA
ncbi:uncharacterized protein MYCFIDRAFT_211276 [Pseudocercospora fijiensis CIRAD86]|uniref:Uncharacterized protein n=1 Tax=Pseudocercospora fijiensis (strain CIRAD86) TaxID=383855 RepID=M3AF57_PSEFD|nr:uncharacterized protein MYCFIDRAFT_211276 [Pseudocercospora fijiensis CIRAD86]EME83231.1 hypothetical protein MYCFIDRAFT_211276 [Pseudocercospora fijiensis CIRAD86]